MKKTNILNKLENAGVIAVVRGSSMEEAINASRASIKGGVTGIELTFTAPKADEIIKTLTEEYQGQDDVVIGAGTVLDAVTARIAILAGAEFIVSPGFDKETAELCNMYQIPYLPGCMTITEIMTAMKAGADIVKVFPGSVVGMGFVSAVKAPLPHANIMPTGGVNLENMDQWFANGVIAVGVGGALMKPAESGDFEGVTKAAQAYHAKFLEIKKGA